MLVVRCLFLRTPTVGIMSGRKDGNFEETIGNGEKNSVLGEMDLDTGDITVFFVYFIIFILKVVIFIFKPFTSSGTICKKKKQKSLTPMHVCKNLIDV